LGKERGNAIQAMPVKHMSMRRQTRKVEWVGYKLYVDIFSFFPNLWGDIHKRGINCCGTVRQNFKGTSGALTARQ
jgi:hypothetical protein